MAVITFNGKTYNSIEEMPANERQAFEQISNMLVDKNGNGIPDFMEGDVVHNVMTALTSSVNFNGKTYNGMNELPEDVREKIQGAFEKMTQLGIMTKTSSPVIMQAQPAQFEQTPLPSSKPIAYQQYPSAIQNDTSSSNFKWVLLIAAGLILCLTLAGAAAFFFLYK